jgi:hypothetical protein
LEQSRLQRIEILCRQINDNLKAFEPKLQQRTHTISEQVLLVRIHKHILDHVDLVKGSLAGADKPNHFQDGDKENLLLILVLFQCC